MNTALVVREDALTQAASTLQLEMFSANSKRAYTSDTLVFRRWLDSQGVAIQAIDYDTMLRYHAYLLEHYSKATAARRFVVARRLLEVAVKKQLLADNPAADVKVRKSADESVSHTALTKREARKLLAGVDMSTVIGKRDYAMLLLMIYGGLRRSELVAATIGDITNKREHYVLTIARGKGNKRRDIPLQPGTFRAIGDYLKAAGRLDDSPASPLFTGFRRGDHPTGQGITDGQLCSIVKQYAAAAGVTATPHDLRSTFITLAVDTGSPIIQVQRLAGHSSPATTEKYYSRKQDLDSSPVYKIDLNTP